MECVKLKLSVCVSLVALDYKNTFLLFYFGQLIENAYSVTGVALEARALTDTPREPLPMRLSSVHALGNAPVFCLSHCDVCVSEGSGPGELVIAESLGMVFAPLIEDEFTEGHAGSCSVFGDCV